ncbi:hypothetical protein IVB30_08500 [Bradyrhizobium sp. 200]|uniref:hypothetical protein n=1 Tax=Bradyrhizobium sp. 200 TaxID=2782665 RepID=UPI001FFE7CBB|nr:hypothetical protein [Bradyrhizobium sp. 200]UPJ51373.1 hypothetical protein IVB30_08500 [Bradyrhizobium sp. 200]
MNSSRPSRLLKSQLCLPLRRLDRHQRDHQQPALFSLLADQLIGYAPMMNFAASLPTHSMHIIRPQS